MRWIKIDLAVFIHIGYLFSEWDNAVGNLNVKMFTTEISTLIKKSLLSSPNLESYSVDFCCALQTRHSRAALPVLEGGPWLFIITQGESGDFMAFSGTTCTYSRRHLSVDTRWLSFAQMFLIRSPQISRMWGRKTKMWKQNYKCFPTKIAELSVRPAVWPSMSRFII